MNYLRLLSRIAGAPLFISEEKLRIITENVTLPIILGQRDQIADTPSMSMATKKSFKSASAKIAGIQVFDSLVSKNASAGSGMTSYESISAQIDAAVSAGASDIVFYIDSPGGEVPGLFGLTDKIRGLAEQGINTIGFTDGSATSAAYAILAACSTAYATPTAIVGSIAAIMAHVETSIGDATAGKTYTIFRSKEEKALADSHTPLTDLAREKITTMLASMDASFNNDVVLSRPNLSVKALVDFKGSEYMAKAGLDLGLIDKLVPSLDAALSDFFSTSTKQRGTKMVASTEVITLSVEEMQAKLAITDQALAQAAVASELAVNAAIEGERARCLAILASKETLRLSDDIAVRHITSGYSQEMSLETMTEIASYKTDAALITPASLTPSLRGETPTEKAGTLAAAYAAATGIKVNVV